MQHKVTQRSQTLVHWSILPCSGQVENRWGLVTRSYTTYNVHTTMYILQHITIQQTFTSIPGQEYSTAQELVPCTYPQLSSGKWQRRSINLSVVLMMTMAMAKLASPLAPRRGGGQRQNYTVPVPPLQCSVVHTATKSSVPVPHSLPTTTSSLQHHTFSQQLWSLAQMRKQMLVPNLYVIHSNFQPINKGQKHEKKS